MEIKVERTEGGRVSNGSAFALHGSKGNRLFQKSSNGEDQEVQAADSGESRMFTLRPYFVPACSSLLSITLCFFLHNSLSSGKTSRGQKVGIRRPPLRKGENLSSS